jgi:hypothetical protein
VLGDIEGSDEHWRRILQIRQHELIESGRMSNAQGQSSSMGVDHNIHLASAIRDVVAINPKHSYDASTLVFLHVQKTGGSTINELLIRLYKGVNVCIPPDNGALIYKLSPGEMANYTVFTGHFNYDELSYIPRRTLSVFCFVRNPRNRLLSLFYYWQAHEPSHRDYRRGPALANRYPLKEFLECEQINRTPEVWNHMTWALMGERQWQYWQVLISQSGYNATLLSEIRISIRARLRTLIFVGLQERFDESLEGLLRILGKAKPAVISSLNSLEQRIASDAQFKKNYKRPTLSDADEAAIQNVIALDSILYEEATALFDS